MRRCPLSPRTRFCRSLTLFSTVLTGALEPIITEFDILVAGPACVDFSALNFNKPDALKFQEFMAGRMGKDPQVDSASKATFLQSLDTLADMDCGQSMNTFLASLRIIARARPKVCIFENIQNAPWHHMKTFWFPMLGYVAAHRIVDSKDFLLPQTRNRGYLIAVNEEVYGQKSDTIVTRWAELMGQMPCPLTATFESYLLPEDDPRLGHIRNEIQAKPKSSRGKASRDTIAEKSVFRHLALRSAEGLGYDNPYTLAKYSGGRLFGITPHVRSWQSYLQAQPARILDSLDIFHQWAMNLGEDLCFKMRVRNLSQNADFQTSWHATRAGVLSCITPQGLFWLTSLGRPLTGLEAIGLHGIPIDKLILSGETHEQLHDAAGNTMSAPVVGSAILLALELVYQALPEGFKKTEQGSVVDLGSFSLPDSRRWAQYNNSEKGGDVHELQVVHGYNTSSGCSTTLGVLLEAVRHGRRYCFCPKLVPRLGMEAEVIVCGDCADTACVRCVGNPVHLYQPLKLHKPLLGTSNLKLLLRAALPGRFELALDDLGADELIASSDTPDSSLPVLQAMVRALSSQVFYMDAIVVTEVATVVYKSRRAYARAVFTDNSVEWYFLLSREFKSRAELKDLLDLSQPIAKLVFTTSNDFVPGANAKSEHWSLWVPAKREFRVTVDARDADGLTVLKVEAVSDEGEPLASDIQQSVSGRFLRKPDCGAAERSLLVKTEPDTGPRVFLFKEVTPLGPREEDHYVFSHTKRQLARHEFREVLLHLVPASNASIKEVRGQDPEHMDDTTTLDGYVTGYWETNHGLSCGTYQAASQERLSVGSPAEFAKAGEVVPCTQESGQVLAHFCLPLHEMPVTAATQSPWMAEWLARGSLRWYTVPETEMKQFIKQFAFAWISQCLDAPLGYLANPQPIRNTGGCKTCSVLPPRSRVIQYRRLHNKMEVGIDHKGVRNNKKANLKTPEHIIKRVTSSVEDADASRRFLDAMGKLLPAFQIQVRINEPSQADALLAHCDDAPLTVDVLHDGLAQVRFVCRGASLAHQANATLQATGCLQASAIHKTDGGVKLFWTFSATFQPSRVLDLPKFASAMAHTQDLTGVIPTSVELQTPRFHKEKKHLFAEQRSAVEWMILRENSPASFTQQEIEEHCETELGLRLTGIAHLDVSFPGGVVAHAVGFGKTVICLALIDHQTVQDRKSPKQNKVRYDRLTLKANLVICSKQLSQQWKAEICQFLGEETLVETIRNLRDLTKLQNNGRLERAEFLIFEEEVFSNDTYIKAQMRVFGTDVFLPSKTDPRTFSDWYATGLDRMHNTLKQYDRSEDDILDMEERLLKEESRIRRELLANLRIPSLEEQIHKAEQFDPNTRDTLQENKPTSADNREKGLLTYTLECYAFRRVILDEFSYTKDGSPASLFVANVRADAKWLLSATPLLRTLGTLNVPAKLLGVHLASPQPNVLPGVPPVGEGPNTDRMTAGEKFRATRSTKSASYVQERHTQGIEFVRHFIRCNTVPDDRFDKLEAILSVKMNPDVFLAYSDLALQLALAGDDFYAIPEEARARLTQDITLGDNDPQAGSKALAIRASVKTGPLLGEKSAGRTIEGHLRDLDRETRNRLTHAKKVLKCQFDHMMWLQHFIERVASGYTGNKNLQTKFEKSKNWTKCFVDEVRTAASAGHLALYGGHDVWSTVVATIVGLDELDGEDARLDELDRKDADLDKLARMDAELEKLLEGLKDDKWKPEEWHLRDGGRGRFTVFDFYDVSSAEIQDEHFELLASELRHWTDCPYQLGEDFDKADKDYRRAVLACAAGETNKPGFDKRWRKSFPTDSVVRARSADTASLIESLTDACHVAREDVFRLAAAFKDAKFISRARTQQARVGISNGLFHCEAPGCLFAATEFTSGISLLRACGHTLCERCESKAQETRCRTCPVQDCDTPFVGGDINRASNFAGRKGDLVSFEVGAKVSAIITLVTRIGMVASQDRIIIFVQHPEVRNEILSRLRKERISYLGGSDATIADDIEEFKQGAARVLVLELAGPQASGSNLTIANHVIFASPLLAADEDEYQALMRQAMGRALRHGQRKRVYIYHMQSKGTVDEQILRDRRGTSNLVEDDFWAMLPYLCQTLEDDVSHRQKDVEGSSRLGSVVTPGTNSLPLGSRPTGKTSLSRRRCVPPAQRIADGAPRRTLFRGRRRSV